MKEWFDKLEARERKMLIACVVTVLVMGLYLFAWEPFVNDIDRLRSSTQTQQQLLEWMQTSAKEAAQLKLSSRAAPKMASGQSLLGVIDRTAKRARLGESIKRVQPDGKTKARVRLENAPFDKVIRWLENLKRTQGVSIINTVIEKQEEAGLINARLILQVSS